ncbi:MAG: hypothetical protein M3295_07520 [Chloroflexota bacterium]|nr:hypothetical protein [Chloroflexota bacterium]
MTSREPLRALNGAVAEAHRGRLGGLRAPPDAEERLIQIAWGLSRYGGERRVLEALPFIDASFELVICVFPLEHARPTPNGEFLPSYGLRPPRVGGLRARRGRVAGRRRRHGRSAEARGDRRRPSGAALERSATSTRAASPVTVGQLRFGVVSRARITRLGWPLLTAGVTLFLLVILLRLWHAHLRIPFGYGGDGLFNLALVKVVIDHGWFLSNPDLGAPLGQHLYDFAALNGDSLNFAVLKGIGLFTSSPGLVLNAYYLLSFPLIAVVAFLVLRELDVSSAVALVCATLYALAPYHFLRGEGHFFLGLYYSVPLGAYLVLGVLGGRPLFARRARAGAARWSSWGSPRTLATLAICIVIASAGIYYAIFTIVLVLTAAVIRITVNRSAIVLRTAGVVVMVIFVALVANMAPTLIYLHEHGRNEALAHRLPLESELYSLKLTELLLPVPGHHLDALSRLQFRYRTTSPVPSEPGQSLGLVGALGFVWLLGVALATAAGSRARMLRDPRHGQASSAALLALLLGTTGGFSALIAYLITPEIRGWNRISIFIAFFALLAVGLLLDALRRRLEHRGRRPVVLAAVLGGVLLFGLFDQTNHSFVPAYSAVAAEYGHDAAFVAEIDRQMPPQGAIFQLPYVPFPENPPVGAMMDYDLLRPYVHSRDLRWSYGAPKGRPSDWEDDLMATGPSPRKLVASVASTGFDGIYIDRFGYADRGAALEAGLRRATGVAPLVSRNGRMSFFSLLPTAARLRQSHPAGELRSIRAATLFPISVRFGDGFYAREQAGARTWRWSQQRARLEVDNPSRTTRLVRLRGTIESVGTNARVTFRLPDGRAVRRLARPQGERLQLSIRLRPGANAVSIATDAPQAPANPGDPRLLFLRFVALRVEDPARTLLD